MRRRIVGGVVMGLMLGLVGCGSDSGGGDDGSPASGGGSGGTLRVAVEDMPGDWMPWTSDDVWVHSQVYEVLVRDDGTGMRSPQLATEWKQTKDALELTLRSGVTFHDGAPFDAEAVKANIEAYQTSDSPTGDALKVVDDVVVKDETHVTLKLSRPSPLILTTISAAFIASPKALAAGKLKDGPVGTGPWRYDAEQSRPGSEAVTTAYAGYWDRSSVHVDRIETIGIEEANARLSAVQTGEVDVSDLDRDLIEQVEGSELAVETAPVLPQAFLLLRRTGALADVRVREAICTGIDAKAIASVLPEGQSKLTTQRFDEGSYGHNPDIPAWTYDPEKAKRLLAEAGAENVELSMAVQDGNRERGEAVAGQLAKIGVTLKLRAMSPSEYFETWRSDFPVGLGNTASQESPYEYYTDFLSPDGVYNLGKVASPKIEAVAKKAMAAPDAESAEPYWRQVAMAAREEATSCVEMLVMENLIYDPNKVSGVKWNANYVAPDWYAIRRAG